MTEPSLPQGPAKAKAVQSMFDTIAPRYEDVNRLISLGLDARWRARALDQLRLPSGSVVVDIAAGTGDFCRLLQDAGMRPIGVDFSFGMLENANTAAPLVQADALALPLRDSSIDGVTCGFALRNFTSLPSFFHELARVVRPGGRIVLLDAAQPSNRLVRAGHGLWFGTLVPRIGGLFSDKNAYRYLPKSLAYLPPAEQLLTSLRDAGFANARRESLLLGSAQLLTATRDS